MQNGDDFPFTECFKGSCCSSEDMSNEVGNINMQSLAGNLESQYPGMERENVFVCNYVLFCSQRLQLVPECG
jgi:hypothetical protein